MKYSLKDNDLIVSDYKNYTLRIKDLPDKEKPREKLIASGAESLSANELLAIILGVGTKKEEVLKMSNRILKEYGEKTIISQRDPKILSRDLDIPLAKACQIVACFELGKRFYKEEKSATVFIRNAKQAFDHLSDMSKLSKENFRALYLNSRYQLIHDEIISVGSLTSSIIHPREVFRPAISYSAAAIIIAHNHPSGSLKPSEADLKITEKIKLAGEILGIDVLDHLIIAKNKFTSLI